jgi:chromosomal replication initiator protein
MEVYLMYEPQTNLITSSTGFWGMLTTAFKSEFGELVYRNWLGHLRFKELENSILTLAAPTRFICEWIETNYLSALLKLCKRLRAEIESINFIVDSSIIKVENMDSTVCDEPAAEGLVKSSCDIFDFALDPRFSFDSFVLGMSNKIAYSVARSVAENKMAQTSSNILHIYGIVGQGKTHLLQSIASHIRQEGSRKVVYLSAEKFMHLYLKYLRANDLIGFKEKIKSCDVLLVDDLQFICGKAATQQEFGNLLSALTEANRTVVISSDVNPFALQLDARSKSRLVGGLVVEITKSDYELRLGILKSKAIASGVTIAENILEFIAYNIMASNRELEGALNKIIAYASFEGSEITMEAVQNLLRANLDATQPKIEIERIVSEVAKYFDVQPQDVVSKSRIAKFVLPRQICAYLAKTLTTKSLQEIGRSLGGRDHASVIYYVKRVEKRIATDRKVDMQIKELNALVKGML